MLVLVSDGGDNASAITRAQVLAKAQASNAVTYTVGLIDPLGTEADPGFLRELSGASGGQSFEPHTVADVGKTLQQVAHDIRNIPWATSRPRPVQKGRASPHQRRSDAAGRPQGRRSPRRAYFAGQDAGQDLEDANDAAPR